jgi:hypothetical protein
LIAVVVCGDGVATQRERDSIITIQNDSLFTGKVMEIKQLFVRHIY